MYSIYGCDYNYGYLDPMTFIIRTVPQDISRIKNELLLPYVKAFESYRTYILRNSQKPSKKNLRRRFTGAR